jgi:hypothetical protein
MMQYDAINDRHICPECYAQVWHHDSVDVQMDSEIKSLMLDFARSHKPKECLPAGEALPGGSKSSKGAKNEKMHKPTVASLNKKLFIQT